MKGFALISCHDLPPPAVFFQKYHLGRMNGTEDGVAETWLAVFDERVLPWPVESSYDHQC